MNAWVIKSPEGDYISIATTENNAWSRACHAKSMCELWAKEKGYTAVTVQESAQAGSGEVIPIADIEQQIAHIKENGISLAKFGGDEVQEGRCRDPQPASDAKDGSGK